MTDEQQEQLKALTQDAFGYQEELRRQSMMNTPTDYNERRDAFFEYNRLRALSNEANAKLNAYIRSFEE